MNRIGRKIGLNIYILMQKTGMSREELAANLGYFNRRCMMTYNELAQEIKNAYLKLKRDKQSKVFDVVWNKELKISEISVENDAEFQSIIIGDVSNTKESKGYMYLFYTNDNTDQFPTVNEIAHRLEVIANRGILQEKNAEYFDWKEYGSLEEQRNFFSEIVRREITDDVD